jgi:hypothetical protein
MISYELSFDSSAYNIRGGFKHHILSGVLRFDVDKQDWEKIGNLYRAAEEHIRAVSTAWGFELKVDDHIAPALNGVQP